MNTNTATEQRVCCKCHNEKFAYEFHAIHPPRSNSRAMENYNTCLDCEVTRVCKTCKKDKPLSEYAKGGTGTRLFACKECYNFKRHQRQVLMDNAPPMSDRAKEQRATNIHADRESKKAAMQAKLANLGLLQ